jgi:hypothetical protein
VCGAGSEDSLLIVELDDTTVFHLSHPPERLPLPDWARREIDEHLAWLERRGNRSAQYYPDAPTALPFFTRVLVSSEDEIWVQRPTATTEDQVIYRMDVYDRQGARLGSVDIPQGVEVRSVVGDDLWGVRRGQYNEQYVVRFQIARAPRRPS